MNRSEYFVLILLAATVAAVAFSAPVGNRNGRALLRRFAILLGYFLLFTGVGWGTLSLSRSAFTPENAYGGWRFRMGRESSVPRGLPAVALTSLLCGIVVLFQYRKQEKLAARLEESERSRTSLLRDLAHDVRSPMTSLRLILDGLQATPNANASIDLLERAATAVGELGYLQSLIDSLLFLAQLEDPDFGKDESVTDPKELLSDLVATFEDLPDRLHLRWELRTALADVRLRGNRVLLDRALRNVFENASRFARARVTVACVSSGDGTVEVLVQDDGPGFSADALAKFGERRPHRFVDTSTPSQQSLGLGSAIVCSCVARLGGAVTVANRPEGGAEVRLRLRKAA